ncbi:MAG: outer membrane lipoprotein carrier protein LolA [Spirochaetales bacterium]|nr:outer membrane lipoprotein carrier protein LolA [Spirochaetales bacterium]
MWFQKKFLLAGGFFLFFLYLPVSAQEIITSNEYFEKVSGLYGKVTDYEAALKITQVDSIMKGNIFYKNPNLVRIDFTEPKDQYLLVNGEALSIHIPKHSVLLKQYLPRRSSASLEAMASSQGLIYLRNNYKIAYVVGPEPIPLEEGSKEMVVKLKFQWRASAEGYKDIEISFSEEGLIRRVIGITATGLHVQFDFTNIKINQGLPEEYFNIDDPPSAYEYKNFLFGDED